MGDAFVVRTEETKATGLVAMIICTVTHQDSLVAPGMHCLFPGAGPQTHQTVSLPECRDYHQQYSYHIQRRSNTAPIRVLFTAFLYLFPLLSRKF